MNGESLAANVALKAFFLIFLAEMGDKTQLMSMMLAGESRKPVWVFVGAATALVLVTLIGVFCGELIGRWISPRRIQQVAGFVFILFGVLMLIRKA